MLLVSSFVSLLRVLNRSALTTVQNYHRDALVNQHRTRVLLSKSKRSALMSEELSRCVDGMSVRTGSRCW